MKTNSITFLKSILIIFISLLIFTNCEDSESDNNELLNETGEVTDIEENTYKTVKIGTQWWMTENLKVTKYRNGEIIPIISDNIEWSKLTSGALAWYQNDYETKGKYYGPLYNWYTIEDERGLCPEGWSVPNDSDWDQLFDYLGGEPFAGGKLKSLVTAPETDPRWNSPNVGATNESGFTAFPSGYRNPNGEFDFLGDYGFWWSSTEWIDDEYSAICISNDYWGILPTDVYVNFKLTGYSIRCIKDN